MNRIKKSSPWMNAVVEMQLGWSEKRRVKPAKETGFPKGSLFRKKHDLYERDYFYPDSSSESFYVADPDEVYAISSPWLH